jgi:hypothetical protein
MLLSSRREKFLGEEVQKNRALLRRFDSFKAVVASSIPPRKFCLARIYEL